MRILVLSDNHRKNLDFNLDEFDAIIHAGDRGHIKEALEEYHAYYVCGNCDFTGQKKLIFNLFNRKIFLTHGDIYDVKYSLIRLMYAAMEAECSVCIYGHTHIPDLFIKNDILFLNPGAYQDGFYAIICDSEITIYLNDKVFKRLEFRW